MTTRRKVRSGPTVSGVRYVLEQKSDWPDPTTDESGDAPAPEESDAVPTEWSGDLYEQGDETSPDQAFSAFSGPGGMEAWLDRADDGTLTGWVRDPDGSLFRYSDADAWAIDVDDAGMSSIDAADDDGPDDEDEEDDSDDLDTTDDEAEAEEETDDLDADAEEETDDLDADAEEGSDDEADDEADDEEETDEDFFARISRKTESKSFTITYTRA